MRPFDSIRAVMRFGEFERDPDRRRLRNVASIDDLRLIAKRRLPGGVFDYFDGAAEDEITLARNTDAYREIGFAPRVLVDISTISIETKLFGRTLPMPYILAPTGFTRIAAPEGELAVVRVAERLGIPYTLSTLGTRSIEEVAAAGPGAIKWFQVYVWKDRGLVEDLLARAEATGYEAIMLTVDTAVFGKRDRDVRRGFTLPPKVGASTVVDGIRHPRWTADLVRSKPITFENLTAAVGDGSTAVSLASWIDSEFDTSLSWRDLEWLRDHWKGPIMLKGIATAADAIIAADHGVDAVALSNHGGRQLDGAPAPIEALPSVVDAVGDRLPVLLDSGIRRGSDLAKAIALGATAGMGGRPYLYGLSAGGEAGVEMAVSIIRSGLLRTMALLGATSLDELTPAHLRMPHA